MATCNSCGGVIGRDCFNPQECAMISQRQEQEYVGIGLHNQDRIGKLENEIQELRQALNELRRYVNSLNNIYEGD